MYRSSQCLYAIASEFPTRSSGVECNVTARQGGCVISERRVIVLLLRLRGRLSSCCRELCIRFPGLLFPARPITRHRRLCLSCRRLGFRCRGARSIETIAARDLTSAGSESFAGAWLQAGHIHAFPFVPIRVYRETSKAHNAIRMSAVRGESRATADNRTRAPCRALSRTWRVH